MWWRLHYGGRGGSVSLAVSAADIALHDLLARRLGVPLWRLLGGFDAAVPCYAGGIDLEFTLDALLKQTDDNLDKGFRAIKMKVGRARLSEDAERVKAMRAHLGADFPLMADANMRWTVDELIRAARAFRDSNLIWLEEPTIPDDVAGHARIVREGGVPIATGENLHTLHEFTQMIAAGGVTFPEPDVTNCGGITVFMKVAHLAEAYNLPVTSHGAHDLTVHLLAALPNRSYLEVHGFGLDRYIERPIVIRDGVALAPDTPGHGVAFDWKALEKVRAGGTLMTDTRPFDPALFRADAIASRHRATQRADDPVADRPLPEWWVLGAETFRAARRRGEGPFPRAGDVASGAHLHDHRQGRQRNSVARDRPGQSARHLSAYPRRRLGAWRRRHAGPDAGAHRRQHRPGGGQRGISAGSGASVSGRPGRLRGRRGVAGAERQEGIRHRRADHWRRVRLAAICRRSPSCACAIVTVTPDSAAPIWFMAPSI